MLVSVSTRDDATGEWVHVEIITTFGESMVVRSLGNGVRGARTRTTVRQNLLGTLRTHVFRRTRICLVLTFDTRKASTLLTA